MSERQTVVRLKWAGGVHRFDLNAPRLFDYSSMVEQSYARAPAFRHLARPVLHDAIGAIYGRLTRSAMSHDDIVNVIRVGLVGGGDVRPDDSSNDRWRELNDLVDTYVRARPLSDSIPVANMIIVAAMLGLPPEYATVAHAPIDIPVEVFAVEAA